MALLRDRGWLSGTPPDFQRAILSRCAWQSLEAGAPVQEGGEEIGELVGLARGIVEIRPVLGRADTPIVHFAHPVFWFGYVPIVGGGPRRLAAAAKTPLWLGRIPQAAVRKLLNQRPEWWRELTRLSIIYGDVAQNVAADLLIRDNERRCAAVLLRLGGRRFPGPEDGAPVEVPVTQDDLAGATNLSRNSVGTMLKKLKARGLVEPGYRGMTICLPKALRAFLDQG
jgi:CRP/FNR family transcriptional regulator, cyclic AMP receptor protein